MLKLRSCMQFAAVMQFMQAAHLADPRQARQRVVRRQVLAGMEHFVGQVTQHHAAAEQPGNVGVQLRLSSHHSGRVITSVCSTISQAGNRITRQSRALS